MPKRLNSSEKVPAEARAIAKKIRARRQELGLTQEKVAERIDVSWTAYQSYERLRWYPSLTTLIRICKVLNLEVLLKEK